MAWLTRLCELLFVPTCGACDTPLQRSGSGLCDTCMLSVCELGPSCPHCAEPLTGADSLLCSRCRGTPPVYTTILSPYRYGGQLGEALRTLKYNNRPDIARTLAPLISPMVEAAARACDLVIPLPLHRKRHCQRGFNQSQLLATYARPGVPIDTLSLRRVRETPAQSSLTAAARASNVAGAFAVRGWRRKHIVGRTILLVDDVVTTGATMNAAATALRDAGATAVVGFCVARAQF